MSCLESFFCWIHQYAVHPTMPAPSDPAADLEALMTEPQEEVASPPSLQQQDGPRAAAGADDDEDGQVPLDGAMSPDEDEEVQGGAPPPLPPAAALREAAEFADVKAWCLKRTQVGAGG
jgi:hypothetical protein